MGDHVIVNISGHRFCVSKKALRRFPHTRLSQIFLRDTGSVSNNSKLAEQNKQKTGHEYFFDRSPVIFGGIMDLYRSGSIHIPPGSCWQLVQDELEFWQVDSGRLCKSCQLLLAEQVNRQKELHEMQHAFGDDARRMVDNFALSTVKNASLDHFNAIEQPVKEQLVAFFREPSAAKTRWARAYKIVFTAAVSCYVFNYLLESDNTFRIDTNTCQEQYGNITLEIVNDNISNETEPTLNNGGRNKISEMHKRYKKYFTTAPTSAMLGLDAICLFLFTVDFILRCALAPPPRLAFLKLNSSIADIVMTIANLLATFLVWLPKENFNCRKDVLSVYLTLEIFRVARLARLLQFTSRYNGIRVLLLSLSTSFRELLLLLSGLLTAVVVFGMTIYVSEIGEAESNYDNFTVGFWWALVSMTTVGKSQ